ncbi:hypothetical protein ABZX75_01330 [Streptomyces sp. NPDC003038]|uniref:hypothetical protein n=1 Tax=unclassified Streptomyces TaxID=2593676 RepID=UPI0033A21269
MNVAPDRRMRLRIIALALCAAIMITVGAAAEWWWLLGIGVWTVIVAFLTEMIYRP